MISKLQAVGENWPPVALRVKLHAEGVAGICLSPMHTIEVKMKPRSVKPDFIISVPSFTFEIIREID
jgi:hypothetical protein